MSNLVIPTDVVAGQALASDPAGSAWVSANAGSGKTHVLAQRVIRLLLDGVPASKILCLTFTKAAAANMANRVLSTLAGWTALDDGALDAAMRRTEGSLPSAGRRERARRLFAEALETPGGLKVQTIHAFCTALLHQFPFEADVAARFEVLEERAAAELIDRLRLDVSIEAATAPDTALGRALAAMTLAAADTTVADVLREAIGQRAAIEAFVARTGGLEPALAELASSLGLAPGETREAVEAAFRNSPLLPWGQWSGLIEAFGAGSVSDRKHLDRLRLASTSGGWDAVEAYLGVFCTGSHEPRKSIVTKAVRERYPELAQALEAEQTRVCDLIARRRAVTVFERSAALLTLAATVLGRYRAEKDRRGMLDYADLIEKTLALFANAGAAWVHYKLDLGIDHVLVDEAQDTSPQQWTVIRSLTAEFTAGEGARAHVRRSIFAVGDEKQSIYSFQGAVPRHFDEMRQVYEREHRDAGRAFARVPFRYSFRSAPDILGAVDAVFRSPAVHAGLASEDVATLHQAVRRQAPGHVDIWDLEVPAEREPIEAWDAPFDTTTEQSPVVRLARRIAAHVKDLIARGECIGDGADRRPLTAGDVLVLVRQRGGLFEAIIRALKDARVPVAGADRLVLTEHIAVMDLMSLADALLLPEDDLALAEVLKSPLFGLDDDDLFAIAHGRSGSLRAALRARAAGDARFAAVAAMLDRLAACASAAPPFAFYAELLGAGGLRRRMLARLGPEASDALDEFLALALDYERRHTASLQGFMAWMRAAEIEIKRDMDIVRDEVRVMTVHGAKGLEAPLVILADTVSRPEGPRAPRLLPVAVARHGASAPIVWATGSAEDTPVMAEAREAVRLAARQEHRRLLYVAMTRAADRLLVCGARGRNAEPAECWYRLVADALSPGAQELTDAGGGRVLRWRSQVPEPDDAMPGPAAPPPVRDIEPLPAWLSRDAPEPPPPERRMTPSTATVRGARPSAGDGPEAQQARLRGRLVHRLLQALPPLPPERRAGAAAAFLARVPDGLETGAADAIAAQVLRIISDPAFAALFAADSRAEVPVVARLQRAGQPPLRIDGQIDRLAVTPGGVFIGDFKTDRNSPREAAQIPASHVTQLALYRAAVGSLYPGRPVRAVIIYTETARLLEPDGPALDAALGRLGVVPA